MADPVSGSTSTPSTDGTWLSDVNSFLSSPTGQVATAAIPAAVGLYTAGQATSQGNKLAGQITAAGAPAGQLGAGTYGQLTGGPSVGGPMGAQIAGSTGTAAQLTQTAQQYASGNLTPAQQQQIDQYVAAEQAQATAALGNRADSSTRTAQMTQIRNNAAMLGQSMVQGNVQIATNAMTSVNQTYQQLLGAALSQSLLGLDATKAGVTQAIQSDQAISQYVQQLLAQIAQGLSGSSGQPGQQPGQAGGQAGQTTPGGLLGSAIKSLFTGGGGAVAQPTDTVAGFSSGGGIGGSDYSPYVSTGDPTVPSTLDPTATGGVPNWLGTGSTDSFSTLSA